MLGSELEAFKAAAKVPVASVKIAIGEQFTEENIMFMRVNDRDSLPHKLPFILGKRSTKNYEAGELVEDCQSTS